MNIKKQNLCLVFFQVIAISRAILDEEIGKDLPTNYNNNDILARRRRPLGGGGGGVGGSSGCNFNGIRGRPKATGSGRTFFDLQFFNVGYHQNYEINCGGAGGHPIATAVSGSVGSEGHKPLLGGHGGGEGQQGGIFSNKPSKPILSMILGNRPLQGIFSQSQTQTQTGILGDTFSSFTSLLPKPQDIGQGLGDGISSFIQTLPQIGQSFQSLLPSFENFQLPSLPSLPPFVQGSQSMAISGSSPPVTPSPTSPPVVTPAAPDLVTEPTVDPDDIIYNDDIKPVHEDPDVTGPHTTNKLPPGAYFNRHYAQNRYQSYKNYQDQKINAQRNRNRYHYQQNTPSYGQREPRLRSNLDIYSQDDGSSPFYNERLGSKGFRFPT